MVGIFDVWFSILGTWRMGVADNMLLYAREGALRRRDDGMSKNTKTFAVVRLPILYGTTRLSICLCAEFELTVTITDSHHCVIHPRNPCRHLLSHTQVP